MGCNELDTNNIAIQFDSAEEYRFLNFNPIDLCNKDAIYYSCLFEIKFKACNNNFL